MQHTLGPGPNSHILKRHLLLAHFSSWECSQYNANDTQSVLPTYMSTKLGFSRQFPEHCSRKFHELSSTSCLPLQISFPASSFPSESTWKMAAESSLSRAENIERGFVSPITPVNADRDNYEHQGSLVAAAQGLSSLKQKHMSRYTDQARPIAARQEKDDVRMEAEFDESPLDTIANVASQVAAGRSVDMESVRGRDPTVQTPGCNRSVGGFKKEIMLTGDGFCNGLPDGQAFPILPPARHTKTCSASFEEVFQTMAAMRREFIKEMQMMKQMVAATNAMLQKSSQTSSNVCQHCHQFLQERNVCPTENNAMVRERRCGARENLRNLCNPTGNSPIAESATCPVNPASKDCNGNHITTTNAVPSQVRLESSGYNGFGKVKLGAFAMDVDRSNEFCFRSSRMQNDRGGEEGPESGNSTSAGEGDFYSENIATTSNARCSSSSPQSKHQKHRGGESRSRSTPKTKKAGVSSAGISKRRRDNWTESENGVFVQLVVSNMSMEEMDLRRMLARQFSPRRTHEQCANHLRILRAQGKLPPAKEEAQPLKPTKSS